MDKVTDTPHARLIDHSDLSSSEDDAVPLSELLKKLEKNCEKHCENVGKDKSVPDSSDDEDDVPLGNLLKKDDKPSEKTAGLSTDVSSDDEPLAKFTKRHPPKNTASSSDNQPLSEVSKRPLSRQRTKAHRKPKAVKKPKVLDSSDDEDDVPLVNLLEKPKDDEPSEKTAGLSSSEEEDDVPLVNLLKKSEDEKASEKTADVSSDDEPLAKFTKRHPPKNTASSSDNQPLSEVSKRPLSRQRTKAHRKPKAVKKPKVLDSSDNEDDVPLVNLLEKPKDDEPSEKTAGLSSSEEEDDVPLVNLLKKSEDEKASEKTADVSSDDEPLAKFTKRHPPKNTASSSDNQPLSEVSKRPLSRQRTKAHRKPKAVKKPKVLDSSDDEDDVPLVNLLEKPKDDEPSEKTAGSWSDSSDDEPQMEIGEKNPPRLTKFLKVVVERCDVEGFGRATEMVQVKNYKAVQDDVVKNTGMQLI
ncbi:hypothetical protein NHX12_023327 [Muraenolepis orangiensis]|uniref:Uncharacterized protein n=1 Tax=Muraenolepis orangiensis TaxID=630683 RepID=A0A9Q0EJ37_9TELE|nr:hypothetical protein NHX12_023327 [Muraenolepis orangiensis]